MAYKQWACNWSGVPGDSFARCAHALAGATHCTATSLGADKHSERSDYPPMTKLAPSHTCAARITAPHLKPAAFIHEASAADAKKSSSRSGPRRTFRKWWRRLPPQKQGCLQAL